jgi:hypothetical protein
VDFNRVSVVGIKAVHLDFRVVFRLINDSAGFTKLLEHKVTPFDSTAKPSNADGKPGSNKTSPFATAHDLIKMESSSTFYPYRTCENGFCVAETNSGVRK